MPICGSAASVMMSTLTVMLSTPHDYSGTLQGGYSARCQVYSLKEVLKEARRALYHPEKAYREHFFSLSPLHTLLHQLTFSVNDDRTTHLLSQASSIKLDHFEGRSMTTVTACVRLSDYCWGVSEVFVACDSRLKLLKQTRSHQLVMQVTSQDNALYMREEIVTVSAVAVLCLV